MTHAVLRLVNQIFENNLFRDTLPASYFPKVSDFGTTTILQSQRTNVTNRNAKNAILSENKKTIDIPELICHTPHRQMSRQKMSGVPDIQEHGTIALLN